MIYGTHNSATGGQLLWWLKPLAWLINPTSKCQDRTIQEQLIDGVKVFNLQVAYIGGKWRFSHGLALYKEDVFETLERMRLYSSKEEPIYFQLYLDKSWWCKSNVEEFKKLINQIYKEYCNDNFIMLDAWDERASFHWFCVGVKISLDEHYWTTSWVKVNAKSWIDKLPLPRRHAKKYNREYKDNCKSEYLMLDFYEY